MPDFHQPDEADRAEAERAVGADLTDADVERLRRHAVEQGVPGAEAMDRHELIRATQAATPSQRADPNWPDAPKT